MSRKPLRFVGSSHRDLRAFPDDARRDAGFNLDAVQRALEPLDWKPMKAVGVGVSELRISGSGGAYRVIYLASLMDAVYVLHCFQKKSQATSRHDIGLARARFRAIRSSL